MRHTTTMTTKQLRHFLLIYDVEHRKLDVRDLGEDAQTAAAEYSRVEEELEGPGKFEVVLIGADSLETIKTTHAHYFEGEANGSPLRSRLTEPAGLA